MAMAETSAIAITITSLSELVNQINIQHIHCLHNRYRFDMQRRADCNISASKRTSDNLQAAEIYHFVSVTKLKLSI